MRDWGQTEVMAVVDPTGVLSMDNSLFMEIHPHHGVTIADAHGDRLLSWKFSKIADLSGGPQTDDPTDMDCVTLRIKSQLGSQHANRGRYEVFEFETNDGKALSDLYEEALCAARAETEKELVDRPQPTDPIGTKVAKAMQVLLHFYEPSEIDKLQAGLHLARAALGFSCGFAGKGAITVPPEHVTPATLMPAMRAVGVPEHVNIIFGQFDADLVPFSDMMQFIGVSETGFEDFMVEQQRPMGPELTRVKALNLMGLRRMYDNINTNNVDSLDETEFGDALRKLGIAFAPKDLVAALRKLTRHRTTGGRKTLGWFELVEGFVDGTLKSAPFGAALLAEHAKLKFPTFFGYVLETPGSVALPEEVAFVFHDGLGGMKISPASTPHEQALMTIFMAQISEFTLEMQSDDPEDCEMLTMKTRKGDTFLFEVEDADRLGAAQKQAALDCQRVATARSSGGDILSPLQKAMLQGVFDVFDVNGDGTVTANELRLIFSVIGTELCWEETFSKLDVDGNGMITLDELYHVVTFETAMTGSSNFLKVLQYDVIKVKEAFDVIDKDGSGTISVQELQTLMQVLGHTLTDEQSALAMSVLDADGSGFVDWAEFLHAIANKDLDAVGLGTAFKTETIAGLGASQRLLEGELKQKAMLHRQEQKTRKKLEAQLQALHLQLHNDRMKSIAVTKNLAIEAQRLHVAEKKERIAAAKRAQMGRAAREGALAALVKRLDAINGWKIQIRCRGLKATGVVQEATQKMFGPSQFSIKFEEPFPEQFPQGYGTICLDRADPACGKRVIVQSPKKPHSASVISFRYVKYPFQLVGSGPTDISGVFRSGRKIGKGALLARTRQNSKNTKKLNLTPMEAELERLRR